MDGYIVLQLVNTYTVHVLKHCVVCVCVCVLVAQSCLTRCNLMDYSLPGNPWDFPGKNTEVGCHSLLQGIFPSQGLMQGLLHCRQPAGKPLNTNALQSMA